MKNIKFIIAILVISISFVGSSFGQDASTAEVLTPQAAEVQVSVKPEGTIRIGVVAAKAQLGQDVAGQEAGDAVRQLWMSYLKGPAVEVVAIDAKSPTNVNAEAKQKDCDFVLYSGVSKKAKTSFLGGLVKIAAPIVASQIPGGAIAGEAAKSSIKQAVAQSGKELANNFINSKVGAKDEFTLEFVFAATGSTSPAAKGSASAKAKADGEDIFTTLIEQASEKVLQAAVKK